jgi:HK97 family phage major capsid protein
MLIAANPAYDAAFGRWIMGRDSQADAGLIKMAVSNTGLGSETPVPITIDPTVLYTGDGARSPLRTLSQVITITGLTWRGIGSAGVTLSYGTETAAITAVDPSFDAPDISVVPARGEIQFTVDVDDDWPTLRSELQRMFSQSKFRLEADKFLNGTGTNEPTGLIFALDADGTSVIDTATPNVLALADVIGISDDLPAAFDYNANWLAHKAFYSNVAALAAAEGRIDVWVPLSGGFNQQSGLTGYNLLNSPAATASEMSKLFTTGSEEVAVIGDFSQGFVIVDRVGLNVELDLHPRDTNGKWTGNRGLLCWFRNNTALRTPNAFRLLRIKHT